MAKAIVRPIQPKRSLYIALCLLLAGSAALSLRPRSAVEKTYYISCAPPQSIELVENSTLKEQSFGEYTFQTDFSTETGGYFRLLKNGQELYRENADHCEFSVMAVENNIDNPMVRLSASATPNLVVIEGRQDNLKNYHVLEIGNQVKELALVVGAPANLMLSDHNGDKKYEFIGDGDYFDAWGHQPLSPSLAYACDQNSHKLHLIKLPCDRKTLKDHAQAYKTQFADLMSSENDALTLAPAELADEMANLVYHGNAKQANWLLNASWPKSRGNSGKEAFKNAFYKELKKGRHWQEVKALNLMP